MLLGRGGFLRKVVGALRASKKKIESAARDAGTWKDKNHQQGNSRNNRDFPERVFEGQPCATRPQKPSRFNKYEGELKSSFFPRNAVERRPSRPTVRRSSKPRPWDAQSTYPLPCLQTFSDQAGIMSLRQKKSRPARPLAESSALHGHPALPDRRHVPGHGSDRRRKRKRNAGNHGDDPFRAQFRGSIWSLGKFFPSLLTASLVTAGAFPLPIFDGRFVSGESGH